MSNLTKSHKPFNILIMRNYKHIIVLLSLCFCATNTWAFDLKGALSALTGKTEASDNGQSGSSVENALGSLLNNLTGNTTFDIAQLEGNWSYVSPAVSFRSDNALQNIGGAAASVAIENKLAPYYKTAGLTTLKLNVNQAMEFTLSVRGIKLSGTVTRGTDDESDLLIFNFKALKKVPLGNVKAMASKSGNQLSLTFDVERLLAILQKVGGIINSTTINTVTDILKSYDEIYAGFRLKKS